MDVLSSAKNEIKQGGKRTFEIPRLCNISKITMANKDHSRKPCLVCFSTRNLVYINKPFGVHYCTAKMKSTCEINSAKSAVNISMLVAFYRKKKE